MKKNKKRIFFSLSILFILILAIILTFLFNQHSKENYGEEFSEEYYEAFSRIEEANKYVIEEDRSDTCFPYRVFNKGCYYDYPSKDYLIYSDLKKFDLNSSEIFNLCHKFAHKGSVAYCLNKNNFFQECLNFAGENIYLKRVCNLKEGEIIPSRTEGPYNYSNCYPEGCENFDNCTEEFCFVPKGSIDLMKYSDLI